MGRPANDITGQRFGSLVALRIWGKSPSGVMLWQCACDCGGSHVANYQSLARKQCTRCAACRTQKRRAGEDSDPLYHIHIKCPGAGHLGGMLLALDHEGNLKAFGGWSSLPVRSSTPLAYRPIHLLLTSMENKGLITARRSGERGAAWEQRNRVVLSIDRLVPDEVMRQWWDRVDKAGLIDEYPPEYRNMWERTMIKTIERRLTDDLTALDR